MLPSVFSGRYAAKRILLPPLSNTSGDCVTGKIEMGFVFVSFRLRTTYRMFAPPGNVRTTVEERPFRAASV